MTRGVGFVDKAYACSSHRRAVFTCQKAQEKKKKKKKKAQRLQEPALSRRCLSGESNEYRGTYQIEPLPEQVTIHMSLGRYRRGAVTCNVFGELVRLCFLIGCLANRVLEREIRLASVNSRVGMCLNQGQELDPERSLGFGRQRNFR